MDEVDDINDAFSGIVLAENRFSETGYKEGYDKGSLTGWQEGFNRGIQYRCQIDSQVRFYMCFCETARDIMSIRDITVGPNNRIMKSLVAMESLLADFPTSISSLDERVPKLLNALRGKYKQISSLLNVPSSVFSLEADCSF